MASPLRVNAAELLRRPGSQKAVELDASLADSLTTPRERLRFLRAYLDAGDARAVLPGGR